MRVFSRIYWVYTSGGLVLYFAYTTYAWANSPQCADVAIRSLGGPPSSKRRSHRLVWPHVTFVCSLYISIYIRTLCTWHRKCPRFDGAAISKHIKYTPHPPWSPAKDNHSFAMIPHSSGPSTYLTYAHTHIIPFDSGRDTPYSRDSRITNYPNYTLAFCCSPSIHP